MKKTVCKFSISNYELSNKFDPMTVVSRFFETEAGIWIKEHATEITGEKIKDYATGSTLFIVVADLTPELYTYLKLRFG